MKLKHVIASYSGESYNNIIETLTEDHLELIGRVAKSPIEKKEINEGILQDLIEMHVLAKEENDNLVKLETAVFLEGDIKKINEVASDLSKQLVEKLIGIESKLEGLSPEKKNFLECQWKI